MTSKAKEKMRKLNKSKQRKNARGIKKRSNRMKKKMEQQIGHLMMRRKIIIMHHLKANKGRRDKMKSYLKILH